jgi:hypothetical protein
MYSVFVRNWWKDNPAWPNGLEPDGAAPKRYLATDVKTIEEARALCAEYNRKHKPGRYSRKAEFEENKGGRTTGSGKRRSA